MEKAEEVKDSKSTLQGAQILSTILGKKDNQGYTVLTLAAKLGCREMFELVMETPVYRQIDTKVGVTNVWKYDITEIDSAQANDHTSVMELIMRGGHKKEPSSYYEIAELSPILDLIRIKWRRYRWWYYLWGAFHLLMMGAYTGLTLENPGIQEITNFTDYTALLQSEQPMHPILNLVFDTLMTIYSVLLMIMEIVQIGRHLDRDFDITNEIRNDPYRILMILFGLSMIGTYCSSFVYGRLSIGFRSFSFIFGWLFTLFFTRGFKLFSVFTVMMQKALTDVFKVTVVYMLVLVPYTACITLLTESPESKFKTFGSAMFEMFLLTLGIGDVDSSFEFSYIPGLSQFLYTAFVVTSYILLLNMMIALLSDTCAKVSNMKDDPWHLQKLGVVLFIEARILKRLRFVCGKEEKVRLFQNADNEFSTQLPEKVDATTIPKELKKKVAQLTEVKRHFHEVITLNQRSLEDFKNQSKLFGWKGPEKRQQHTDSVYVDLDNR